MSGGWPNAQNHSFTNPPIGVAFHWRDACKRKPEGLADGALDVRSTDCNHDRGIDMSKGMDSKKSDKKKPAKTMKEKKAAKEEKKKNAK
ncbi:hypothetical protein [Dyella sp. OK004]|uniref:hypothetical protein n=1 Tax=Dyella sp. OK004 TaxID=1855292 RepID=UPI0015A6524B|nr:hypothetical protein [Dyella sp. OK004]